MKLNKNTKRGFRAAFVGLLYFALTMAALAGLIVGTQFPIGRLIAAGFVMIYVLASCIYFAWQE